MFKASDRTKKIILLVCSILILFPLTFGLIKEYPYRSVFSIGVLMAIGTFLSIVIILIRVDRTTDLSGIRRLPTMLMMITGLGILVAFMHHETGWSYLILAFDMIVVFPLLYAVETYRKDYRSIMISFSLPVMASAIFIFALCIYKMIIGQSVFFEGRYFGPLTNPNPMSMIGTYGVICSLYIAHISRRTMAQMIITGLSAGCGLAIILLGASRTSALVLAGCILIEIIFLVKWKGSPISTPVIVFILAASLLLIPVHFVRTTPGVQRIGYASSEMEEGKVIGTLERFVKNGESLDTFSNGRLDIWRIYYENLTIRGGDPEDIEREVRKTHHNANAHNNYLTIAYTCGIPTGIIYFLWVLCIGILGIKTIFGRRYILPEQCFAAMIIYSFAVQSMLDIAVFPFWNLPVCMFSFCIAPVFER